MSDNGTVGRDQIITARLKVTESHTEVGEYLDVLAEQGYSISHEIRITLPGKNFEPVTVRTHWIVEEPDLNESLEDGRKRLLASLADLCDDSQ